MFADGKTGNAVVRVGDDLTAHGIHPHLQALGGDLRAKTGPDLGLCLGMQGKLQPEGRRRTLPGVVVGRRTNAAEAEDDVTGGKSLAQGFDQTRSVIPRIACPTELEPARTQQFDDFGQMLVSSTPRQDLVANDECTKIHSGIRG